MTRTQTKSISQERGSRAVLMVGPIPVAGSYVGGIGVSLRRLLDHWSLPVPVVHLNTELSQRTCGVRGRVRMANCARAIVNFVRLSWWTVRLRPILVHYHTSRGMAFLKDMLLAGWVRTCLRRKMILHVRSSDMASILISRSARWQRLQVRVLLHCCDRLVFLSRNVLDDFAAVVGRKAADKLRAHSVIIPNFTLVRDICRNHREPDTFVKLFFIGNVGLQKGAHDIITAASQLKERSCRPFRVTFAGPFASDHDERMIRGMIADANLSDAVVLCGPVSGRAKEVIFVESDVFVLPSYSEGIPQAMLEAMAYGLPVVVSRVGGIPEVVQDGEEGLIIDPGDIDALCSALQELIESTERRRRMGEAGRRTVAAHYTLTNYMRQLQELYDSVLEPLSAPAPSRVVP